MLPDFVPPGPTYTQQRRPEKGLTHEDFQWIGSTYLIQNPVAILGDDMGLGKCKQTLDAIMYVAEKEFPSVLQVLILCEASNIDTWMEEIKHWYPTQAAFAYRGADRRVEQKKWLEGLINDGRNTVPIFNVMSYAIYRNDCEVVSTWNTDWVVLDEGQVIRGCPLNDAQSRLGEVIHWLNPPRKTFLSGTPLINMALADFYNIGRWLGIETRDWQTYADECLVTIKIKMNKYKMIDKIVGEVPAMIQDARAKVQSIMLRRTKDDVMPDLPKMRKSVRKIRMSPDEAKKYLEMKKVHEVAVQRLANGDDPPMNPMVALQKMLYLTSAIDSKIEAAYEIAKEAIDSGQKVLIFTTHLDTLRMLYKRCKPLGLVFIHGGVTTAARPGQLSPRGQAVDAFQNDPNTKVLIGTAQACRTGLTLTAAELMILIDEEFSPKYVQQLLDRMRRIGQEKPTRAIRLEAVIPSGKRVKVTIERQYHRMLQKKGISQDAIVELSTEIVTSHELLAELQNEDDDDPK